MALKVALWNFAEAVRTDHLVNLPVTVLTTLLDNEHANVPCEAVVFEAIKEWTCADQETRNEDCCQHLLKCVRWNKLTQEQTSQIVNRCVSLV